MWTEIIRRAHIRRLNTKDINEVLREVEEGGELQPEDIDEGPRR